MSTTVSNPFLIIVAATTPISESEIYNYWNDIYSGYNVIIPPIVVALLLYFFYMKHKHNIQITKQLNIHLIMWIFCMTCSLFLMLPGFLVKIFPGTAISDFFYMLISGSMHYASTETMPISTTFVIIDRILAISFVSINRMHDYYLPIISVITLGSSWLTFFMVLLLRGNEARYKFVGGCGFGCIVKETINDILTVKIGIGFLNIALGTYFVYLYFRFLKKMTSKRDGRKNYTVLLILITELFCTILPTIAYLIWTDASLPFFALNARTAMTIGYCTDGFSTAIIFFMKTKNHDVNGPATSSRAFKVAPK